MRVCHIASGDLWAGAEVQVFTLLSFLGRTPDIRPAAVLLNERELARRLRAAGIDVLVLDQTKLSAAEILGRLTRALRRMRPDIVHSHRYKETVLGGLAATLAGVPAMACTMHGLVESERYTGLARQKMRLYAWLERCAIGLRRPTVVAVSGDMARTLAARLHAPICLIPNGVAVDDGDGAADRPPDLPGIEAGDLVVGSAGRLVPVKGFEALVRATPGIVRAEPRARVLLLGDGPEAGRLGDLTRALGVERHVVLAGHRPDIRPYLRRMDLFVLPSLAEGTPMALLEAMAAERPVVVTRVGGMAEAVRDGVEGLLVPPGSPEALEAACLAMIRDPARRAACGARARRRVAEAFSIDAAGRRYVELYRRLAAGAGRAA